MRPLATIEPILTCSKCAGAYSARFFVDEHGVWVSLCIKCRDKGKDQQREAILKLLDEAHKLKLSAALKERSALCLAKSHFGLRGLAKLVGEYPSNLCNYFNGKRGQSPTLVTRLQKALEKKDGK